MWIRTQNKQRIMNAKNIVDIFIDRTGKIIYANTVEDADYETLGNYADRDTCLKVLEEILSAIEHDWKIYKMPLGGDVQ